MPRFVAPAASSRDITTGMHDGRNPLRPV